MTIIMRLLKCSLSEGNKLEISLEQFVDSEIPSYAILFHRRGKDHDEVAFQDITSNVANHREEAWLFPLHQLLPSSITRSLLLRVNGYLLH